MCFTLGHHIALFSLTQTLIMTLISSEAQCSITGLSREATQHTKPHIKQKVLILDLVLSSPSDTRGCSYLTLSDNQLE